MELAPKIHLVPDIVANPYLIIEDSGITLIDTGLPGSHKKILRYITDRGYPVARLTRILLTHSDLDHVGGLAALQRLSGARSYASSIEADAIARGRSSRPLAPTQFRRRILMALARILFRRSRVLVDEILSDGQVLDVLGGLKVIGTPGHTPGHISLFAPAAGVLFAGDSVVSRERGLVPSLPGLTWDASQAAESVRKQAALGARIVCSGHGPVAKDGAARFPAV